MNEQFTARIAEAYGRHSQKYASVLEPILTPMADEIVDFARLKGGEIALDLATGTGLIARTAAHFTDSIIGIDNSLGILARARGKSDGVIPFVAGDAHWLPLMEGCLDLVTCGLSLSHFSDVSKALGEVRRVLRSGGRFITSAWGTEGESPTKAAAVAVRRRFLEDRDSALQGTFGQEVWANAEQGHDTLQRAGFVDVQVTTKYLSGSYRNSSDALEAALAWPITRYRIAQLDPADKRRLREETAAAIHELDDLRWQSEVHYYEATSREE